MSMIEQMARAAREAAIKADPKGWSDCVTDDEWEAAVRAALSALSNPTEGMVKEGTAYQYAVEKLKIKDAAGVFYAMIKAAEEGA